MAETIKTLDQDKKRLQEQLDGLTKHFAPLMELATFAKAEFLHLMLQAQERVKALKLERKKAEQSRQLDPVRRPRSR